MTTQLATDPLDFFRIGEDFSIALDALQGDVGTVTEISARLRSVQILSDGKLSFTDDIQAIDLAVAPRAAQGDDPAGWNISGTAAQSAALTEGLYGIDAKISASGVIDMTRRTAIVEFTKSAVS